MIREIGRRFGALLLACAVAAGTMPMTACDKQQVLDNVQRFAPVVTNLLSVACEFTSSPLCQTGAAILNQSEQHLFIVWQEWINLAKQGKGTQDAWSLVNAALQDLISKSSDVFALTRVVNAQHQKEVLDLAGVAQALLAVIETFLPPSPSPMHAMMRPRMATFLPLPNAKTKKYDAGWFRDFEKQYNALPAVEQRHMQIHRSFWSRL